MTFNNLEEAIEHGYVPIKPGEDCLRIADQLELVYLSSEDIQLTMVKLEE